MSKKNCFYCAHCGTSHGYRKKKCSQCGKKLPIKDQLLWDYLKEHIKDELKEKVTDSIYSILKNYLLSHLYGVILVGSVLVTSITVGITYATKPKYEVVASKPVIVNAFQQFQDSFLEAFIYQNDENVYSFYSTENYGLQKYNELLYYRKSIHANPETLTVDRGFCKPENTVSDYYQHIFDTLEKEVEEVQSCHHYFYYCQTGDCDATQVYDLTIDWAVVYIKENGAWRVFGDIMAYPYPVYDFDMYQGDIGAYMNFVKTNDVEYELNYKVNYE